MAGDDAAFRGYAARICQADCLADDAVRLIPFVLARARNAIEDDVLPVLAGRSKMV